MSTLTVVVGGCLLILLGLLITQAARFIKLRDAPYDEERWCVLDPIEGESLRTYAKRVGVSENMIDKYLIDAYNQAMGRFIGTTESRDFYPFVIATIIELASHACRGITAKACGLNWQEVDDQFLTKSNDPIDAISLTNNDWKFFIRDPAMWNRINGKKSVILNGIYTAYWAKEPFHLGAYTGQLRNA